jgi:hypothetical protein
LNAIVGFASSETHSDEISSIVLVPIKARTFIGNFAWSFTAFHGEIESEICKVSASRQSLVAIRNFPGT